MLMLDFELDDEKLVQGFVRLQWPGAEAAPERAAQWARLFQRSASLWTQFGMRSAAVRLEAKPGAPLTSLHAFVAPKAQELRLRLALAALLRTHGFASATGATPRAPEDLDEGYLHAADARLALNYEPLTSSGGARLRYNLRLFDRLDQIIAASSDFGVAFAYEAQIVPWRAPKEALKRARYDVAELERQWGTPEELLRDQRAFAERLTRAAFHVEECLACATSEQSYEMAQILENLLSDTVYGHFDAPPRIEALAEAQAEAFGRHVHSSLWAGADGAEFAEGAATKEDVDARMALRVLLSSSQRRDMSAPDGPGALFATLTGASAPRAGLPGPNGAAGVNFRRELTQDFH